MLKDIASSARLLSEKLGVGSSIGVCGFCFGGGRMMEALGSSDLGMPHVDAAVAFYPTRVDQSVISRTSPPPPSPPLVNPSVVCHVAGTAEALMSYHDHLW